MVSPPGSQPVRIQTEGRGTATRQTPETPARQPKSGPHLSRRQRRKKQRDAARQGQQATETVKTTFRQTPAAVGRDVARQGQQITETVRTPLQQTPGVVSGDVARQGRQATETVRAPFRQTPAVSGREVARQGQRTTETVRTPLQQTSGFRQRNQVQTERQAAVRQEVRMAPPGRRPGTSTQPQHRGNLQQIVQHSVQGAGHEQVNTHGPAQVAAHSCVFPSSLFVPGRVAGRNLTFLIDTGCTHNLLSRTVFDRLPAPVREHMREQESTAAMADGSGLPIYGSIRLEGRLRNTKFEADFLICRISDDGILGMSFLRENDCSVACDKGLLVVNGVPIPCTDRTGRLLVNKVQVLRTLILPPDAETQVCCRLNSTPSTPIGLIESLLDQDKGVAVAATLGKPSPDGKVLVRCLNLSSEPQELKSGSVIGLYQPIEEDQIEEAPIRARSILDRTSQATVADCPEHVLPLLNQTREVCDTVEQYNQMAHLLTAYADVFSAGDSDVGRTDLVQHSIPLLEGTKPIRQPPRRLGAEKDKEVEDQVAQLVEKGMVEPTDGSWSSPVVLVRKKDQSWRLCVDYRRLNAVTRKDAYPLPRIDDSLDALSGSIYFSTLDLVSGYWQVPLDEEAQQRSAFVTRGGLWRWKVLPFGLTSAPATFERLMERVLKGLQWRTLLLYLDDIIVFSKDFYSHLERLEEVFQRFRAARLKLKPSKCQLFQKEVAYLGHVVSQDGVATDPDKVEAVRSWPSPKCVQEVRSFLGFVGYYRRFCPDFATISRPLNLLTSKESSFKWEQEEEDAFQTLKQLLMEAPVLTYPDPSKPYILDTDASNEAAGAVLSQETDGEERVVAYFSKTFSPPQRNYCVTRRELLAVVLAVTHFRPYLYGRKFLLRTDHASLIWLYKRSEPSHQIARWLELLAEFEFVLEHRPGTKHGNADGLSRCTDCPQCVRIESRDGGPSHAELQTETQPQVGAISLKSQVDQAELEQLQDTPNTPIAIIKETLMTGVAPDPRVVETSDAELARFISLLPRMEVRAGILKIRGQDSDKDSWTIVCPKALREPVIWEIHRQGHIGIDRTTKRLQKEWYWPGLTADTRRLINSCEVCQAAKHSNPPPNQNRQRLQAGRPWQVVSLDLVGPFPATPRGNTNILVLSDHFTRWRDAIPVQNGSAEVIAETLEERIFCYFGIPERLHTDQGAQFESRLMAELCALWGISKSRTTPYHPQSNGVVERGNRDLGDMLRTLLLNRSEDDWDLLLPYIMRSIRASPHQATSETPNFLMMGREVRLPEHLLYGPDAGETYSREQYALEIQKRLEVAHDLLRKSQLTIRTNDRQERPSFNIGQLVWLRTKRFSKGSSQKLQPKYSGPYTVLEVGKNHTYLIEQHGRISREAESRLKAYIPAKSSVGRAPNIVEPTRQLSRQGMARGRPQLPTIMEEEENILDKVQKKTQRKSRLESRTEHSQNTSAGSGSTTLQPNNADSSPAEHSYASFYSATPQQGGVAHSTPRTSFAPEPGVAPSPMPSIPEREVASPEVTQREDNTPARAEPSAANNDVAPAPTREPENSRPTRERRAPTWMQDYATEFPSLNESVSSCQTVSTPANNLSLDYYSPSSIMAYAQIRTVKLDYEVEDITLSGSDTDKLYLYSVTKQHVQHSLNLMIRAGHCTFPDCVYQATDREQLQQHAESHYIIYIADCGHLANQREEVLKHIQDKHGNGRIAQRDVYHWAEYYNTDKSLPQEFPIPTMDSKLYADRCKVIPASQETDDAPAQPPKARRTLKFTGGAYNTNLKRQLAQRQYQIRTYDRVIEDLSRLRRTAVNEAISILRIRSD